MEKVDITCLNLRPHHCGMSVPHLEASIIWYSGVLNFSLEKQWVNDKIHAKIALLKRGDFYLELFEVNGSKVQPESRNHPDTDITVQGTKHMAFEVTDTSKFAVYLRQKNVDIVWEKPGNIYIHDNSGILIEFMQVP